MNIKNIIIGVLAVLVLLAGIQILVGNNQPNEVVAVGGTRMPSGLSADNTEPVAGQVRGTTFTSTGVATFGGDLTITTTNTATSSVEFGCWDSYATSTDTAVRLSATSTGAAMWVYGTCSGL